VRRGPGGVQLGRERRAGRDLRLRQAPVRGPRAQTRNTARTQTGSKPPRAHTQTGRGLRLGSGVLAADMHARAPPPTHPSTHPHAHTHTTRARTRHPRARAFEFGLSARKTRAARARTRARTLSPPSHSLSHASRMFVPPPLPSICHLSVKFNPSPLLAIYPASPSEEIDGDTCLIDGEIYLEIAGDSWRYISQDGRK
jgi:hypothetical protein